MGYRENARINLLRSALTRIADGPKMEAEISSQLLSAIARQALIDDAVLAEEDRRESGED